ncbi:EamA family transporter RarD [Nocardioides zeae]|uniref:EamA family transporter RarD n=1 Tax=Nocardioides imazamoxiresistens TaxID=3231893 RepID=A0ABU3Q1G0_9ACTN|nr:EamA family transporter RarD [Nocardioides zeae]MDT9594855.1 EamA family transporter RarD [Nocardioides zeae]
MSGRLSRAGAGFTMGVGAYTLWGVFPLYFPLLEPAGPVEILAQRVLWSVLTMAVLVLALRRTPQLRALLRSRRTLALLAVAAATISVNWVTFIYGVTTGHVLETSLGYFVNPLVTVLLGVLVLGERLRRLQWAALAIAATAVVVLTVDYGRLPWIAVLLAFSFGTYGLVKKTADVGAVESLAVETALLTPLAAAYVGWLAASGGPVLGTQGPVHTVVFALLGLVTAVPLLLFGGAATRVPMVTLGLLQYLAPIFQFVLGIVWFGEHMPATRWAGFVLVWLALVLFTVEAYGHRRRHLRRVARAATAT